MYFLYPIAYLGNGIATHFFLQSYSPAYKKSQPAIRHELIARWNNALTQISLVAVMFCSTTPTSVETAATYFGIYLLTDMAYMLLYCYDWIFYLHHILPILIYTLLWKHLSFDAKIALTFTTGVLELTSPAISLVWILSKLQVKGWYSPYLTVFAYLQFLGIRLVYFPYFWYNDLPMVVQILSSPYHVMNIFWFGKMTSYVCKSRITQ